MRVNPKYEAIFLHGLIGLFPNQVLHIQIYQPKIPKDEKQRKGGYHEKYQVIGFFHEKLRFKEGEVEKETSKGKPCKTGAVYIVCVFPGVHTINTLEVQLIQYNNFQEKAPLMGP